MKRYYFYLIVSAYLALASGTASAQATSDFWTQYAKKQGANVVHTNNCGSSEVFIAVGASSFGYCIEKDYRTAATWDVAKDICAQNDARLPEPMEWKFACKNPPSGLNDMGNGWEWASNSGYPMENGIDVIAGMLMGGSNCASGGWGGIGYSNGTDNSFRYRCVK